MKKQFFFVHGGPGFTSKPEEKIIGPLLPKDTEIYFWNELSPLRGATDLNQYFQKNVEHLMKGMAAEQKKNPNLVPIFFSFGLQYLFYLPESITNLFPRIILVAPSADHSKTDKNIFNLALTDFKQSNPENYQKLEKMIGGLSADFDQKKIDAFLLASSAPTLFTNYFNSTEAMMNYFGHLVGDFAFSLESFLAIRSSLPLTVPLKKFQIPTIALFGNADPITPMADQNQALRQRFPRLEYQQFDSHKHFLHIENPQLLLNCFL